MSFTCQLSNSTKILPALQAFASAGHVDSINIITSSDSYLFSDNRYFFDTCKWNEHIKQAWPFFHLNIYRSFAYGNLNFSQPELMDQGLLISKYFSARDLTDVEKSISLRHLLAWKLSSEYNQPTLIIEDDALLEDHDALLDFLHVSNKVFSIVIPSTILLTLTFLFQPYHRICCLEIPGD